MLIAKRIFLNSKRLTYYISTSAANRCDDPGKESPVSEEGKKAQRERKKKREKLEYPAKVVSLEEKQNAKNSLSALLKSLSVDNEPKQEDSDLGDMLKVEISKKKEKKRKNLEELLNEAAGTVAKDLGGDTKQTKKDLLEHLKTIEVTKEAEDHEQLTIDREGTERARVDTETTLRALEEMFSPTRLRIFEKIHEDKSDAEVKLNIWDRLEEEELAYMARNPPRNQLEEWIMWTEQGRLWQFPIDNDQGMEKEAGVDFTQHVFLEEHLEPWCPKKGPLKKFMDLVLVGLSKNPYLTVEEKKEHIFWYRDYFEDKKKLLQELGAFGSGREIGAAVGSLPEEKQ